MIQDSWRRYAAEAIGTFAIVFTACGAVISDTASKGAVGLAGIALVPGLMVLAMISSLGWISGAHFNPAVTLALALVRRFSWSQVVPYIAAQAVGAIAASAAHGALYGHETALAANYGAHIPNVPTAAAFGFEVIYGFLLMFVIMAVATDPKIQAPVPALAIGLTVALGIYTGGPISGASMNPIRSLAPALFNGGAALTNLPIYLIGPVVGAAIAALLYEWLGAKSR